MSKRILVVEDQEDDRQIIRDMLVGTDYEITEAEDGEQALAAVAKERPDLILMEIPLPSIDAYGPCDESEPILGCCRSRSSPSVPAPSEEQLKARTAGCDDFVPKPYCPHQLLAKIRSYLQ